MYKKKLFHVPTHIGIIMDGNGRWAEKRNLNRNRGHMSGIDPIKDSLLSAIKHKVKYISVYIFSTENWKRSKIEISFIMKTIAGKLREHYPFYKEHGVKIMHSGVVETLSKSIQKELMSAIDKTKHNKTIILNLAFNYGGRDEILRAFYRYQKTCKKTSPPLTEELFSTYLDQPFLPFPDLIIRTGGHKRISNFLLWQSAYSELYFSDILWPDWKKSDMDNAISFYSSQTRNFGGLENNKGSNILIKR